MGIKRRNFELILMTSYSLPKDTKIIRLLMLLATEIKELRLGISLIAPTYESYHLSPRENLNGFWFLKKKLTLLNA